MEITSDQGVLTIRGQREDSRRESREGYRRIERITGEFQRRFSLPDSADAQNIKAKVVKRCTGSRHSQTGAGAAASHHR